MAYATGSSTALNRHPLSPRGLPSAAAGHPQQSTPHAAHTPQQPPPQLPQQPRPSISNSFPPSHARSKLGGQTVNTPCFVNHFQVSS